MSAFLNLKCNCWLIIVLVICAFTAGYQPLYAQSNRSSGNRIQLPSLGSSADNIFSDAEERAYAQRLIFQMRQFGVLVEDPMINEFFDDMGFRLVANSDEPDGHYIFVLINEPSINAFAAPGGVIALHSGIIQLADEASEIAAVLSHEIAHVTQSHLERRFERAQQMTIPLALAALGLIVLGGAGAILPALIGTQGISQQDSINFTRSNEFEADRVGINTLYAAGYNPEAMASMFTKMGRVLRAATANIPEYARSHPVSTTRTAEAKNRAAQLPNTKYKEEIDFHLMQSRIKAIHTEPREAITYFKSRIEKQEGRFQEANEYGLVLSYQLDKKYQEALQHVENLLVDSPNKTTYLIEKADILIRLGNYRQGLDIFENLYKIYAGNRLIARYYAEALLVSKQPEHAQQAMTILRTDLHGIRSNPSLHDLMARAANLSGDEIRSASANAEASYWRGNIHEAINQLQRLNSRDDLDYYQRAKISSRLTEMQLEFEQLVRLGYIANNRPS